MTFLFRVLLLLMALALPVESAFAQAVTSVPGAYPPTAPTGYTAMPFSYNCVSAPPTGPCWPLVTIFDGANRVAVKAASTAATISDPALVVALSPNTTLPGFTSTPTVNLGTLGGAATAANQTNVQGPVTPGTAATSSLMMGGIYNSSAPAPSTGQQLAFQLDASGNLKTIQPGVQGPVSPGTAASNSLLTGGIFNSTPPTLTNGQQASLQVDSSGNLQIHTITSALPTGAATLGAQNTGNTSLASILSAVTAAIPAGTNQIGTVSLTAGTSGGATYYSEIVPANVTGISVKGSAGMLYGIPSLSNNGSVPLYVKLYDTASAPTCGSGTPKLRFEIPVNSTNTNGAGSNPQISAVGIAFTSGIGMCVTGGIADADTTIPTANIALVNLSFE